MDSRWELLLDSRWRYAYSDDGAASDAASPVDVERWLFRVPRTCPGGPPRDTFAESDMFVVPCEGSFLLQICS